MTTISYPVPRNEDDFESLCLELFSAVWGSKDLQRNGRRGHRQHGVDIFGYERNGDLHGVQCKLHESPHQLSEKEVREEIEKAKGFDPPLRHYVVATTAKRDPELQRLARQITEVHRAAGLFSVQICSWDDLSESLQGHPMVAERLISPVIVSSYLQQRGSIERLVRYFEANALSEGGHAEIDAAASHLETAPEVARKLLEQLRVRQWDGLNPRGRYRVLANLGKAAAALNRYEEAGRRFVDAKAYQPEDENAQALEALGYFYLGRDEQAFECAAEVLKRNPAQALAAAVLVRAAPESIGIARLEEIVAESIRGEPDVAVALAYRSRIVGEFEQAIAYVRPAIDQEPTSEPVVAEFAAATLGAIFVDGAGGWAATLLPSHEAQLKDALARLTACIAEVRPGALDAKCRLLLLRADTQRHLGRSSESRDDVLLAYSLDPENPDAVLRHALNEKDQGRPSRAIEILRTSKAPKNRVLLATYLRQVGTEGYRSEALEILRSLQSELAEEDAWLRRTWADEIVRMLAEESSFDEGLKFLDGLSNSLLEEASKKSLKASLLRSKGNRESAISMVREARQAISLSTPWDERRGVALQLQSLELFDDAFEVWRHIVTPRTLIEDIENFLYCAVQAEKDEELLEFGRAARSQGLWMSELVRLELSLLGKYNARRDALGLAREFLNSGRDGPEDAEVRAHIALASVRSGEAALAAELVAKLPPATKIPPFVGRIVVEVLRELGQLLEAATYAYDLVRENTLDIDAHRSVLASFGLGGTVPEVPQPHRVEPGVAVFYREEDTRREAWCIIEQGLGAQAVGEMVGAEHPLAVSLMGKGVGDVFTTRKTAIQERTGKILELLDKRIWRLRNSMETWEHRFPEDFSMQRFVAPAEGPPEAILAPMLKLVDMRAASRDQILGFYHDGRTTLRVLAAGTGSTLFEAVLGVAASPGVRVHCCTGSEVERGQGVNTLLNAKVLVLDATALGTIFLAGAEKILELAKTSLLVSEGTIEDLEACDILSHVDGPVARLGRMDGKYQIVETPADVVAQNKRRLEEFLKVVERHCEIVPGLPLAKLEKQKREDLISLIGRATAESAAVAVERGGALWSDDLPASIAAQHVTSCKRVWSQLVFEEERKAGGIPLALYGNLVLGLIEADYSYVWVSPELLLEIGRLRQWKLEDPRLWKVLERFASEETNASSLGVLALTTLSLLWRGDVLDEVAQAVTIKIGRSILSRADGRVLIEAVRKNIGRAFGVNVLGEAKVRAILSALSELSLR